MTRVLIKDQHSTSLLLDLQQELCIG